MRADSPSTWRSRADRHTKGIKVADQKRVTLSLDLGMPEERAFYEAYKGLPKSRAQEFLRRCVMVGFFSRKRTAGLFYGTPAETKLKAAQETDMISKVSYAQEGDVRSSSPQLAQEGYAIRRADDSRRDPAFSENFEASSLAQEMSATPLARAPVELPPMPAVGRSSGWKKPRAPAASDRADAEREETRVTKATMATMATHERTDPDAMCDGPPPLPPALLEERIMRSLEQPSGQSSAPEARTKGLAGWPREGQEIWNDQHDHYGLEEGESEESGQQGKGGKTDASKAGAGDANLLKGFFGEA